jgi:tartrate dehydratase beta subunit/fumarate hydratase class I family protein
MFGVHRMVADGTRSNQKLLALREKGVYSSYTLGAVQLLLGHTKFESTVRYLGVEVDDALEMAEHTEI